MWENILTIKFNFLINMRPPKRHLNYSSYFSQSIFLWPSDWRGGGASERRGHQRLAKFLEKTLILSKNVFTNHLFCDWLYVDFTSEWYTCSCQRVNCKPHFLKCESESFLSRVYSCVLESYLVLDKAGLAKVLEYMIGIKFRNIGWKRKAWIM